MRTRRRGRLVIVLQSILRSVRRETLAVIVVEKCALGVALAAGGAVVVPPSALRVEQVIAVIRRLLRVFILTGLIPWDRKALAVPLVHVVALASSLAACGTLVLLPATLSVQICTLVGGSRWRAA